MRDNDEISMEKAWEYMRTMGEEFKSNHTLYTPIPQKISRCLNLGTTAKIILLDLIGYMGDKYYSYPPIEDIALNCGISHATVQTNMKELEEKKFLIVKRRHNNTYYLPNGLHFNPYILISEVLHEFRSKIGRTGMLSDRQKNEFIRSIIKKEVYTNTVQKLSEAYEKYLRIGKTLFKDWGSKETIEKFLNEFNEEVLVEFSHQYPQIIL